MDTDYKKACEQHDYDKAYEIVHRNYRISYQSTNMESEERPYHSIQQDVQDADRYADQLTFVMSHEIRYCLSKGDSACVKRIVPKNLNKSYIEKIIQQFKDNKYVNEQLKEIIK